MCSEVHLNLAYRWFCRLGLEGAVPDHSHVRAPAGTAAFERSARERRKVEMRFAHLKRHLGFRRLRLRGLTGASDEFLLVAIVQNLKEAGPLPHTRAADAR